MFKQAFKYRAELKISNKKVCHFPSFADLEASIPSNVLMQMQSVLNEKSNNKKAAQNIKLTNIKKLDIVIFFIIIYFITYNLKLWIKGYILV